MAGTDAALVTRIAGGDRSAMELAVRIHHGFLVSMVTPLVGAEVAEDVVQETWMKAFAAMSGFEGRATLRTWLAQIALNQARSRLRSAPKEASPDTWGEDPGSPIADRFDTEGRWSEPPAPWHYNTPDALLTEAELRECIDKHIGHLPPDQQTVLRLRELESMPFDEIAAITGLTEGHVRVLLHRARQRLHAMIEHFEKIGTC